MNKITIFFTLILMYTISGHAQETDFIVGHLFLRVNQIYITTDGKEVEIGGNPYIWLDDWELKIYYDDDSVQEFKFEGDIQSSKEEDFYFWRQNIRDTESNVVADFALFTRQNKPDSRFIIINLSENLRLSFECKIISGSYY